ncbi:hypothetical protein QMZ92_33590 [Streptomyces sp. HNM0645]|uniref:hypothetical protein n=1 Tax=Streptomyces sp. HNM0645 TaxID=2782343 RepID=UPI0024B8332E|nr:hypothetical protein [Streptomyces sp. HNM0645]MDI9889144.1 hypothetical protein [Streptomyces sp. HNM0645]
MLLGTLAALFTGSLLLIEDIDQPYAGIIRITGKTVADTVDDIGEDIATDHPGRAPPFDVRGTTTRRSTG